jgi:hypothetical protein
MRFCLNYRAGFSNSHQHGIKITPPQFVNLAGLNGSHAEYLAFGIFSLTKWLSYSPWKGLTGYSLLEGWQLFYPAPDCSLRSEGI